MDPAISLFAIVVLLGAAQGLFLAIALLYARGGNRVAHRFLAVLTLAFVVELADTFLYHTHFYDKATCLIGIENPLDLLYGPLVYLYIAALTSPSKAMLTAKLWRHFLPCVIGFVLMTPFFSLDADEKLNLLYGDTENVGANIWLALFGFFLVALVGIAQMGAYLGLAIRQLNRHARHIRDKFSYNDQISLTWARNLLIILCGLYLTYVVQMLFTFFAPGLDNDETISDALMLMIVMMIYIMGFLGLRQPAIFARLEVVSPDRLPATNNNTPLVEVCPGTGGDEKYKKSALDEPMSEALLAELLTHMENGKPYLNGELTLPHLAERVGISPHYLSQVINERLEQNFFDFINRYRVEEVKHHLSDPTKDGDNITTLALNAGFNSKSAFYTAFKKVTGMTPKQFKNSLVISLAPAASESGKF